MPIMTASSSSGDFELCPAGTFLATCYAYIELGTHTANFADGPQSSYRMMYIWELPHKKMSDGRPFVVSKEYALSLNKKANLCQMLESWRGASYAEGESDDPAKYVGCACLITVGHKPGKNGKTYAEVKSVAPLMEGMQAVDLVNPAIVLELASFDKATYDRVPKWIQKKIEITSEYKHFALGEGPLADTIRQQEAAKTYADNQAVAALQQGVSAQQAAAMMSGAVINQPVEEDEIPF